MLWDIYEQHLEEAAFLWGRWEQALVAPDHVLDEVAPMEERLHAHVDGLVLGGEPAAKRFLLPALESDDLEIVRAAAFTLLVDGTSGSAHAVLERIRAADDAALAAFQRALEVLQPAMFPAWLQLLPQDENPTLQALGLEVLGLHQCAPAAACQALLTHASPKLAATALRAAGRSRIELAPAMLERALASPSLEVRDAAIEAGGLRGHRSTWAACRAAIQSRTLSSPLPLLLLAMGGDDRDLKELQELLVDETLRPDVLWALGFSGRVASADACLEFMSQKSVAPLAGEAFSAITGLRIEGSYAAPGKDPEAQEPVPLAQEDLEASPVPKPIDALPIPQADAISQWWQQARSQLEPQRRYLEGRPFSSQALLDALTFSSMRRRHALGLELAVRSRGAHQVPTRAFAERQLEVLRRMRTAPSATFGRTFAE
ncbi:TIGR02270 family protein [Hyalangium sp.]|uniref:TIGR02270 family protein n=1 Tax=Hyalangium sp. TaxID=2028555 RepID=UPI002D65746F|nr:TIGR02270 family protein [Hyalangium sp.]HYH94982.1 TIGR02270 family protein [Hyalangium sp.]